MLKKSILSLIVMSAFLSGCGSDDDNPAEVETPNKAPALSASFAPLTEKATSSLSVVASDSDGSISSYAWVQTSGPELTITGADTAEIAFTVPSVSVDTPVSFTISVTDDEGAVTEVSAETNIERIESIYNLAGTVVGSQYANAMILASVGSESASIAADENGDFSLNLAVDDDVELNSSVKLIASNESALQLASLLPSLGQLSGFIAQAQSSAKIQQASTQAVEDTPSISVSAVSTALYTLLVAANGGTEPTNIDAIELVESQIDPNALIEIAAVVHILINSEVDLLPQGTTDLLSVLADPEQYNALVETIEQATPGAIEETIAAIVEDPALTPALVAADIPSLYYQTTPVAASFIARGGSRYEFAENGTGKRATNYGISEFDWAIDSGDILLTYTQAQASFSYVGLEAIPGLSQAQKETIYAEYGDTVETTIETLTERMTRLTTGSALDTFRVESETVSTMTPIETNSGVIEIPAWNESDTSDLLMRKSATAGVEFAQADITGLWGFEVYNQESYYSNHFEILEFAIDGTGVSQGSSASFSWSVTHGTLNLVFADFTQSYSVIDSNNGDLAIYSEAKDNDDKLLASLFGFATQIESTTKFTAEIAVTGQDKYWQTMINQWTAGAWDGDILEFCYDGIDGDENAADGCSYGNNVFGFQVLDDNSGTKLYSPWEGLLPPPNFVFDWADLLSWAIADTGKLKHTNEAYSRCWDVDEACRYREWTLLKVVDGRLGKRIYVQEYDMRKYNSTEEFGYSIAPRWNMYELIDVEYFNTVNAAPASNSPSKAQAASGNTKVSTARIILEPNKLPMQQH